MNTHRVTLTAFGTTGVLLAASLTMLAIVSALVTFDAWPTRNRDASPAEIAIQNPRAARVVRAVRRANATTGSRALDGVSPGSVRGVRAARLPGFGGRDGGGGGNPDDPNLDPRTGDRLPYPYVGPNPPGEGDPGDGDVGPGDGDLVGDVTTTACGAVSTVSADAGAIGACKSEPEAYEDPYEAVPVEVEPPVEVDVPVDVPALP
jgi:hypothetical protein